MGAARKGRPTLSGPLAAPSVGAAGRRRENARVSAVKLLAAEAALAPLRLRHTMCNLVRATLVGLLVEGPLVAPARRLPPSLAALRPPLPYVSRDRPVVRPVAVNNKRTNAGGLTVARQSVIPS